MGWMHEVSTVASGKSNSRKGDRGTVRDFLLLGSKHPLPVQLALWQNRTDKKGPLNGIQAKEGGSTDRRSLLR